MVQTGQVLFRRLSLDFALVLPFKDSNPAVLHPSRSNCRIRLAGLRRRLARSQNKAHSVILLQSLIGSYNPKEWFAMHYSCLVEIARLGRLIGSARTLALQ
jgi:hypothetical protein